MFAVNLQRIFATSELFWEGVVILKYLPFIWRCKSSLSVSFLSSQSLFSRSFKSLLPMKTHLKVFFKNLTQGFFKILIPNFNKRMPHANFLTVSLSKQTSIL